MENLGKFTLFLFALILSTLTTFLGAYVVLQIAELYGIALVMQFSFVQIVGILCILGILRYSYKKDESNTSKEVFERAFSQILSTAGSYLVIWGLALIYHWLLK